MGRRLLVPVVALVTLVAAACDDPAATAEREDGPVMVLTHRGFSVGADAVEALEAAVGEQVVVVVEDDATSMLDLLTASSAGSGIDVVAGLDSLDVGTFVAADLTEPYTPAGADLLPVALRVGNDPITPISYTDVCFNYDRAWFDPPEPSADDGEEVVDAADVINEAGELAEPDDGDASATADGDDVTAQGEARGEDEGDGGPEGEVEGEGETVEDEEVEGEQAARPQEPTGLGSLGRPELAGLVAMPDPRADPFGLAFVAGLATVSPGPPEDGATDPELVAALELLRGNDLLVADDFRSAYFRAFTGGSAEGHRPVVLASALMPAVSARFADPLPESVGTAVVDDGCARLVDYAAVVTGSERPELARRTLDAMVEPEFQYTLSDERGSRPARTDLIRRAEVAELGTEVQSVLLDPLATADAIPAMLAAWDEAGALTAADPLAETEE